MTQTIGKKTLGLSSDSNYLELLKTFPPKPIADERDLENTQKVVDGLIDKDSLTIEERDYLNVLGSLIRDYEEQNHPLTKIKAVELIYALLEDTGLQTQDLYFIFDNEITLTRILNYQQELTLNQIKKLADFFHISPMAFWY